MVVTDPYGIMDGHGLLGNRKIGKILTLEIFSPEVCRREIIQLDAQGESETIFYYIFEKFIFLNSIFRNHLIRANASRRLLDRV